MIHINYDAIVVPDRSEIAQELIEREIANYARSGKTSMAVLNNSCELIEKPEVYYASRQLGLPAVFGQFMTVINDDLTFPERFSIEISNRCNYSCKMCPRTVMTREKLFMDPNLFYKVIDEIHEFSKSTTITKVDLYRLGESTLHPHFPQLLDYITKMEKPFPTQLATNGSRMDEKLIRNIMESSLTYLVISFNALDNETYRQVTGGHDLTKIQKILPQLKKYRTRRTPFIILQFIEQEETHNTLDKFVKEYIDSCDIVISSSLEDFGGQLKQNSHYVKNHVLDGSDQGSRSVCPRGIWRRAKIYANGDLVPCICDIDARFTRMGNVRDATIKEIFDGKEWHDFVRMHKECGEELRKHGLCGPCTEWKMMTAHNKKFTPKIEQGN